LAAVEAVGRLARGACRERAVGRFSADRMVDDYLRVFELVLSR
jgi:hypothetical protein